MAETLTIRTASSTEVVKIAVPGPQGPAGSNGQGVPTGGSTGQVLRKASSANYDTEWATGGGGGVSSWNDLEDKPSTFAPSAHKTSHSIGGTDALSPSDIGAAPATGIDPTAISGTAVVDSDARLSDTRDPNAHAASHGPSGSDPLAHAFHVAVSSGSFSGTLLYNGESNGKPSWSESGPDQVTLSWNGTKWQLFPSVGGGTIWYESTSTNIFSATWSTVIGGSPTPTLTFDFVRLGDFAATVHTHFASDITDLSTWANENLSDVAISGSYNDLLDAPTLGTAAAEDSTAFATSAQGDKADSALQPTLVTAKGDLLVGSAADTVSRLAVGATNGHVLQVDSSTATGLKWAAAPAGDTVSIDSTAADILSATSGAISADDAGSDKIVFWDESESRLRYLEAGSGLSISGTTLTATASGGSKTYAVFTATDNQPPASNFMTLDTRNGIAVLDADDAADESAVFVGIIPEGASLASGLKIRLHWMATTATSGNCVWDVSLERMTTDLDSDSFDTIASSGAVATNGTSGILTVTEITLTTIDSVTAGDGFRIKVTRDANNASDTMTGDAELVAVEIRSAA